MSLLLIWYTTIQTDEHREIFMDDRLLKDCGLEIYTSLQLKFSGIWNNQLKVSSDISRIHTVAYSGSLTLCLLFWFSFLFPSSWLLMFFPFFLVVLLLFLLCLNKRQANKEISTIFPFLISHFWYWQWIDLRNTALQILKLVNVQSIPL